MKGALIVMDMINDFLEKGAVLEVPMGREIIPKIIKRIEIASDSNKYFILCLWNNRVWKVRI